MMGMLMVTPFHLSEWKVKIKRANALCVGDFSKEKRRVEDGFRSETLCDRSIPRSNNQLGRVVFKCDEKSTCICDSIDLEKFEYVSRYDERYVHL